MRVRLADLVHERDEGSGTVWVAPVPDGPMVRVDGIGPVVLAVLAGQPEGATLPGLVAELGRLVPDMPSDAQSELEPFLESLIEAGVLDEVPDQGERAADEGTGPA